MAVPQIYVDTVTEQLGISTYLDSYSHPNDSYVEWHSIHEMYDGTFVLYSEDNYGNRYYEHSVHTESVDRWKEAFRDLEEDDRAQSWGDPE